MPFGYLMLKVNECCTYSLILALTALLTPFFFWVLGFNDLFAIYVSECRVIPTFD